MKYFALILALVVAISCFCACSVQESTSSNMNPTTTTKTMETDSAKIDGCYVDTSYVDPDGKPLKLVYLFITFFESDRNYDVDAKYTNMKIGANTYSSDFYKNACDFMPNYYYSSFIEEIYVGSTCKVALTFKVPEGDLRGSKEITLSDFEMPLSGLCFSTDDIKWFASAEEIGKRVDPTGYNEIAAKKELADTATTNKVRNAVNGYYFEFYVTLGTSINPYELEFFAPNEFEVRTPLGNNSGTYEVRKGYIFLYYKTSNDPLEIPYEFKNGEIYLSCSEAFGVYE